MSEGIERSDLSNLEAALGSLVPSPARLDRDRLLFLAGQASGRGGRWVWCGVGASLSAVLVSALFVAFMAPTPTPGVRVVYVPAPARPARGEPMAVEATPAPLASRGELAEPETVDAGYLSLERQVLSAGIDSLPGRPRQTEPEPPVAGELLSVSSLRRPDGMTELLQDGF